MIRIGNLYDKIISIDNLRLADEKAQRGKKHQKGVIEHNKRREDNIQRLHQTLVNREYKTSEYSIFTIYEPKERTISVLPYFPNRILHHSIINIIGPIFVRSFISQTYSCIKGRGIHKALTTLRSYLNSRGGVMNIALSLILESFMSQLTKILLNLN